MLTLQSINAYGTDATYGDLLEPTPTYPGVYFQVTRIYKWLQECGAIDSEWEILLILYVIGWRRI